MSHPTFPLFRSTTRLLMALLLAGFFTSLHAIEHSPYCYVEKYSEGTKSVDADNNGEITIVEAVSDPVLLANFHRLDKNKNKRISKEELTRCTTLSSLKKHDSATTKRH